MLFRSLLQHLPLEGAFKRGKKEHLKTVLEKFIGIVEKESDPNVFEEIKDFLDNISETIVDVLYEDPERSDMSSRIKVIRDRFEYLFVIHNKVSEFEKEISNCHVDGIIGDMGNMSSTLTDLLKFVFSLPNSLKDLKSFTV